MDIVNSVRLCWRRAATAVGRARAALAPLVIAAMVCPASSVALATEGGVLFLSSSSPTTEWAEAMLGAIDLELAAQGKRIALYVEFLDRHQLPGTPSDAEWAAFLATKYRDSRPAAIIADGAPAIRLIAGFGARIFPDAPVVGVFPNFKDLGDAAEAVAVKVTTGPHIDQTVAMALADWPDARKLVIVSDDTQPSHHLAAVARAAVARQTGRTVAVEHLFDFALDDLEIRLATLPPDSIVLYTHVFTDNTGRRFRPNEIAARMATVSAAPIYVLFDTDIGTGVVGGYVNNSRVAGRVAARAALGLLDQGPALDESHYSSQAVVDWRQLRRWGIDEHGLPPGAEIRFRQPSLTDAYFAEVMIGLAFIGFLSAVLVLISILFVQRGRHARALGEANSRLEERVAARTRDIERALMGEQEARRRLRTFLDMATHEFKTPLAVIDSSVQLLERLVDTGRDGVGSRLTLIRASARRVVGLVETCLAGERFDEEHPLKATTFSPAALVHGVVERQRGHGAIIVSELSGLPAAGIADPDLLGIALDALLDNARRYGPPGERVDLTAWHDGECMAISVCDRGPGIPEAEVERIFEKYFRGTYSRGTPGTGIGLDLVRTIAELHGGSVACRPRDGGGAMFVLTIPLAPRGTVPDALASAASP